MFISSSLHVTVLNGVWLSPAGRCPTLRTKTFWQDHLALLFVCSLFLFFFCPSFFRKSLVTWSRGVMSWFGNAAATGSNRGGCQSPSSEHCVPNYTLFLSNVLSALYLFRLFFSFSWMVEFGPYPINNNWHLIVKRIKPKQVPYCFCNVFFFFLKFCKSHSAAYTVSRKTLEIFRYGYPQPPLPINPKVVLL